MLTGRPPFTDDDAIVVMARHIKTPARAMSEVAPDARIPPDIEALVMRVLSKEPERRPQTADALMAELTRLRDPSAVGTSGVRASLTTGFDRALDRSKSLPPPPPTPPSALTYDTLSTPLGLPSSSRRWTVAAGAIGVLALSGAVFFAAFHRPAASTGTAGTSAARVSEAAAPFLSAPAAIAPAPPRLPPIPPPPQIPSPPSAALPVHPSPASTVRPPASAPVVVRSGAGSPGPASNLPASAASHADSPRVDPPRSPTDRHGQRPAKPPGAASKPAGTSSSSVGYGYLE